GSFWQLGLDFLVPDHVSRGGIQADQMQLQFFLISTGVLAAEAAAALALTSLAKGEALRDGGAIAGITGHKNLAAGGDRAGSAHAGQLDLEEEIVPGPLDRQILVVGNSSLGAAEARPVRGVDQRSNGKAGYQKGSKQSQDFHGDPPRMKNGCPKVDARRRMPFKTDISKRCDKAVQGALFRETTRSGQRPSPGCQGGSRSAAAVCTEPLRHSGGGFVAGAGPDRRTGCRLGRRARW